jgi:hypothetical protein
MNSWVIDLLEELVVCGNHRYMVAVTIPQQCQLQSLLGLL